LDRNCHRKWYQNEIQLASYLTRKKGRVGKKFVLYNLLFTPPFIDIESTLLIVVILQIFFAQLSTDKSSRGPFNLDSQLHMYFFMFCCNKWFSYWICTSIIVYDLYYYHAVLLILRYGPIPCDARGTSI
jgi:hypothetical protein